VAALLVVAGDALRPTMVARPVRGRVTMGASDNSRSWQDNAGIAAVALAVSLGAATPAFAVANEIINANGIKYKLPPLVDKPGRCKFVSSSMGQANGARDSQFDLRACKMPTASAEGFDLSGMIAADADFSSGNFKDAQLSKGYFANANLDKADFTNGVVDRVDFEGASLKGAIFSNTVLTSTSFQGADVAGADFTEAYLGDFDLKKLCKNPTLTGEIATGEHEGIGTRESAGCK